MHVCDGNFRMNTPISRLAKLATEAGLLSSLSASKVSEALDWDTRRQPVKPPSLLDTFFSKQQGPDERGSIGSVANIGLRAGAVTGAGAQLYLPTMATVAGRAASSFLPTLVGGLAGTGFGLGLVSPFLAGRAFADRPIEPTAKGRPDRVPGILGWEVPKGPKPYRPQPSGAFGWLRKNME